MYRKNKCELILLLSCFILTACNNQDATLSEDNADINAPVVEVTEVTSTIERDVQEYKANKGNIIGDSVDTDNDINGTLEDINLFDNKYRLLSNNDLIFDIKYNDALISLNGFTRINCTILKGNLDSNEVYNITDFQNDIFNVGGKNIRLFTASMTKEDIESNLGTEWSNVKDKFVFSEQGTLDEIVLFNCDIDMSSFKDNISGNGVAEVYASQITLLDSILHNVSEYTSFSDLYTDDYKNLYYNNQDIVVSSQDQYYNNEDAYAIWIVNNRKFELCVKKVDNNYNIVYKMIFDLN